MMGKTALPDNFEITPEMRDWANRKVPQMDIDYYHDEFCDHWLGNGKRMLSWVATWRNWMRRTYTGTAPGMLGKRDLVKKKRPQAVDAVAPPPTDFEKSLDRLDKMRREVFKITDNLYAANRMSFQECRDILDKQKAG